MIYLFLLMLWLVILAVICRAGKDNDDLDGGLPG